MHDIIPQPYDGLLFFAHGSSMNAWRAPFDGMVRAWRAQQTLPCALGFLERMQPDFLGALTQLLIHINPQFQTNASLSARINVVPLFLAHSVHTARDLPQLIGDALDVYPELHIDIAPALLEDEVFLKNFEQFLFDRYGQGQAKN